MLQVVSIFVPYCHLAALKVSSLFVINFFLNKIFIPFTFLYTYIFSSLNWCDFLYFFFTAESHLLY